MRDLDMEALDQFQKSDDGKAYAAIYALENSVDDLTDASKMRQGVNCLRYHFQRIRDAKIKLDDLMNDLTPFAQAAE